MEAFTGVAVALLVANLIIWYRNPKGPMAWLQLLAIGTLTVGLLLRLWAKVGGLI